MITYNYWSIFSNILFILTILSIIIFLWSAFCIVFSYLYLFFLSLRHFIWLLFFIALWFFILYFWLFLQCRRFWRLLLVWLFLTHFWILLFQHWLKTGFSLSKLRFWKCIILGLSLSWIFMLYKRSLMLNLWFYLLFRLFMGLDFGLILRRCLR